MKITEVNPSHAASQTVAPVTQTATRTREPAMNDRQFAEAVAERLRSQLPKGFGLLGNVRVNLAPNELVMAFQFSATVKRYGDGKEASFRTAPLRPSELSAAHAAELATHLARRAENLDSPV